MKVQLEVKSKYKQFPIKDGIVSGDIIQKHVYFKFHECEYVLPLDDNQKDGYIVKRQTEDGACFLSVKMS